MTMNQTDYSMEDICPPCEGSTRDEDEDLRIMAELNNPRIYRDVQNIIRQEQRIKVAITRNKHLPYPCKCYQLCEFGELLDIMYSSYERLYETYDALHSDYTTIFRASSFLASGRIVQVQEDKQQFVAPLGSVAPIEVNLEDFEMDANMKEERREALNDEDVWRKTYELHMECVRLTMIEVARPRKECFMDWVYSHVWAKKKCTCYHCDYRDALLAYRHAIITLHLEYLGVYANYLALLHCKRMQDSRSTTKTLTVHGLEKEVVECVHFS